jgi:crotonobetainyl-CoA:carnitine CoA-transferase CaiB-like acyl-CoA transferase
MVQTKDGWIVVQVLGDTLFKRWANLIGAKDLLTDERFKTDSDRGINGKILSKKTSEWASQFTNKDALDLLAEASVPAGPVNDLQSALDDPHVKAMNFFQDIEYPGVPGKSPVMGLPIKLSNSDNTIKKRPPLLGEHTDELLLSLGYDTDKIKEFRDKRII